MSKFPIKAEFNVCSDYYRCFALGKCINSDTGHEHDCVGCDLYRAYLMGFSEGARRAVDAITTAKSNLIEPMFGYPDYRKGDRWHE